MNTKATQYRDDENFMTLAMRRAKELGISFNQAMKDAMRQWLGLPEKPEDEVTLKGTAADVLLSDGVCYNWTGKRRVNTMLPVHLVSHGKLWLVDRTKNYSHKILHSVCVLPQCLLNKVGEERGDYIPELLTNPSNAFIDCIANLLQVEVTEWFQAMHPRQQAYVIEAALRGDTLEQLVEYYAPKPVITESIEPVITTPEPTVEEPRSSVITEPEVVITPQKAKATQLQQRYGISADEWHQKVSEWKKQCLKTVDGLVWEFKHSKGLWVTI